ncbi:MAG TPA: 50S ribosomal protein L1 [Candidatus Nanoarchaeia archaeon]|nr:50S ribosomal protein L1 [Candidatus Nanoarchaeia archaeon]
MEKKDILNTIQHLREKTPKKQFSQSIDILINLQEYDLKKQEKIDLYITLPHQRNKKIRLAAFVDAQLSAQAKKVFNTVITKDEFPKWINNKKEQKKLASEHDYFVAQMELMANLAGVFGKILGARGKMPNPKAGCVVPGNIQNLEPVVNRLKNTVRLQTKNEASVKAVIGDETMKDEDIAENILAVYNSLIQKLPQASNNIKYAGLKLTMGPLFKIGAETKKK